jgi:hypothetical protein
MTSTKTYGVSVCGDLIEVEWDGNVWVDGETGAQYAHAADALRDALDRYFLEAGMHDDEERAAEIEGYLAKAE